MKQTRHYDHLILLHDSNYASNVGNAFFTQGAKHVLETACPSSLVLSTASLTSTGWRVINTRRLENDLNYMKYSEPDWFVLTGPLFNENFPKHYGKVFKEVLRKKRTKLVILSAGGITYTDEEISICRIFLRKYKPFILFTRDDHTFDNYSDLAEHSYNGICTAFFVPDYYKGYPTPSLCPNITLTFDSISEPRFEFSRYNTRNIHSFRSPDIEFKPMKAFRRFFSEKLPAKSGSFTLVRPVHRVMNTPLSVLLRKPNSFFSMTPFGYLNIYRNTSLTLTDRVHASVATLAYGNPARLYSRSKRAQLLERVGLGKALEQVVQLDPNRIKLEKTNLINTLENIRNNAS